jgi:hypothetical protein
MQNRKFIFVALNENKFIKSDYGKVLVLVGGNVLAST